MTVFSRSERITSYIGQERQRVFHRGRKSIVSFKMYKITSSRGEERKNSPVSSGKTESVALHHFGHLSTGASNKERNKRDHRINMWV
jgi:hypothetical protein